MLSVLHLRFIACKLDVYVSRAVFAVAMPLLGWSSLLLGDVVACDVLLIQVWIRGMIPDLAISTNY